MPDGDSLNWKIRGRNSRRVLGLVRSGADPQLVGQEAGRMLVKQAKAGAWIAPIRDVAAIVVAEFDPESFQDSARRIRESAGQVVREHRGDSVGWMLPAVDRTVSMLERKGHSPTEADIRGEFMSAACQSLIDHRVLQPARQEIAKESGRDRSEQIAFEQELLNAAGREGARLAPTFLSGRADSPVRTPRRTIRKRETDLSRLSESLPVLGGAL